MSHHLVPVDTQSLRVDAETHVPEMVLAAGGNARFAYEEFFEANIANEHTREAYRRAVHRFLLWCEQQHIALTNVMPAQVGKYITGLRRAKPADQYLPASAPMKKQHLAALRNFFDALVLRHVIPLNPAASVKGPKYSTPEGQTPEMTAQQAGVLLGTVDTSHVVGLRDRAILATLIFTAARTGAIAKLNRKSFYKNGNQCLLHFAEKGGKSRHIPVRHDLQTCLEEYLSAAGLEDAPGHTPLFRSAKRKVRELSENRMDRVYIWHMIKRRCLEAGLPAEKLTGHSIRAMAATDLLEQDIPLADVQYLLGHADPRTTRLYDRRKRQVTRNTVERISVKPIYRHSPIIVESPG